MIYFQLRCKISFPLASSTYFLTQEREAFWFDLSAEKFAVKCAHNSIYWTRLCLVSESYLPPDQPTLANQLKDKSALNLTYTEQYRLIFNWQWRLINVTAHSPNSAHFSLDDIFGWEHQLRRKIWSSTRIIRFTDSISVRNSSEEKKNGNAWNLQAKPWAKLYKETLFHQKTGFAISLILKASPLRYVKQASTWCIRPQFSRVECIGSFYHHTYLLLHLALEEIHNQRFFHQDEHLSQKHTLLFPSCVSAVIPPCKVPPDLHRLWRHHNPLGSHLGGKAISYNRCVIRTGWLAFERSSQDFFPPLKSKKLGWN